MNEKIFELFDHIDEHSLEDDGTLLKELNYVDKEWDQLPDCMFRQKWSVNVQLN